MTGSGVRGETLLTIPGKAPPGPRLVEIPSGSGDLTPVRHGDTVLSAGPTAGNIMGMSSSSGCIYSINLPTSQEVLEWRREVPES